MSANPGRAECAEDVNWFEKVTCPGCGRTTTRHDLRDHAMCEKGSGERS